LSLVEFVGRKFQTKLHFVHIVEKCILQKHGRKIIKATNIFIIGTIVAYILLAIAVMAIPYYIKSIFTF